MLAVVVSTAYQYCLNARGQLYNGPWLGRVLLSLDGVIGWFFVVSAFLLYAPLVRQGLTGRGAVTPRGFLIRRLLRAVPLYWLAIIVVWAYRTSKLPGDCRDLAEHLGPVGGFQKVGKARLDLVSEVNVDSGAGIGFQAVAHF